MLSERTRIWNAGRRSGRCPTRQISGSCIDFSRDEKRLAQDDNNLFSRDAGLQARSSAWHAKSFRLRQAFFCAKLRKQSPAKARCDGVVQYGRYCPIGIDEAERRAGGIERLRRRGGRYFAGNAVVEGGHRKRVYTAVCVMPRGQRCLKFAENHEGHQVSRRQICSTFVLLCVLCAKTSTLVVALGASWMPEFLVQLLPAQDDKNQRRACYGGAEGLRA